MAPRNPSQLGGGVLEWSVCDKPTESNGGSAIIALSAGVGDGEGPGSGPGHRASRPSQSEQAGTSAALLSQGPSAQVCVPFLSHLGLCFLLTHPLLF